MKHSGRIAVILTLILALVITMLPLTTAPAEAASKAYKTVELDFYSEARTKACGYYFWLSDDNNGYGLYVAKSETGKGTKIASKCDDQIVTNGSKVFYVTHTDKGDRIYSASMTGKNKKKIYSYSQRLYLGNCVGGRLYFQRYKLTELDTYDEFGFLDVEVENRLYSISASNPKKASLVNKNFSITTATDRYLYHTGPDSIKIFDSKNKKVIRTIKKGSGFRTDNKNLYYSISKADDSGTLMKTFYRSSMTGKNAKKLISFPADKYLDPTIYQPFVICYHDDTTVYSYDLITGEIISTEPYDPNNYLGGFGGPF